MSWRWGGAAAALAAWVAIACGGQETTPPPDRGKRAEMPGETVTLSINAPISIGESSVTAGNLAERDYTATDGSATKGLTALLWVIDPNPAYKKNIRVHPGSEFELTDFHVRVLRVKQSGVEIEIVPHEAGEP